MNSIDKLKKAINGRICCVISKGKSVEELEQKIEMFRGKDVCWIIQNRFDYIENDNSIKKYTVEYLQKLIKGFRKKIKLYETKFR